MNVSKQCLVHIHLPLHVVILSGHPGTLLFSTSSAEITLPCRKAPQGILIAYVPLHLCSFPGFWLKYDQIDGALEGWCLKMQHELCGVE